MTALIARLPVGVGRAGDILLEELPAEEQPPPQPVAEPADAAAQEAGTPSGVAGLGAEASLRPPLPHGGVSVPGPTPAVLAGASPF